MKYILLLFLTVLLWSCSDQKDFNGKLQHKNISTLSTQKDILIDNPSLSGKHPQYEWQKFYASKNPYITKEFFRCHGNSKNPIIKTESEEDIKDCNGFRNHSLPLSGTNEFIYPSLINILNYLQDETGHRVVITCGYRCPQHNKYADPSSYNNTSKHMIGAEADFYIEGLEDHPEEVIDLILNYYRDSKDKKFKRYKKKNTNVSTYPWYNDEIFVKLFKSHEGRDWDNRHQHPYVSIQIRYDKDEDKSVSYSWDSAFKNYLRW